MKRIQISKVKEMFRLKYDLDIVICFQYDIIKLID